MGKILKNTWSLVQLKQELIQAHRDNNWELAVELSQLRQRLKLRAKCVDCGVPINKTKHSLRCGLCYRLHRYYGKNLNDAVFE